MNTLPSLPDGAVLLGRGCHGAVYSNPADPSTVIKRIPLHVFPLIATTPAAREERAYNWIDTLSPANRAPFAVRKSFSIARAADTPFVCQIVMEHKGSPVNMAALDRRQRVDVVCQLLQIVHFLHRSGVAHLDINSKNVLTTAAGAVSLVDYGEVYFANATDAAEKETYEYAMREYAMETQVAGFLSNIDAYYELEDTVRGPAGREKGQDEWMEHFFAHEKELARRLHVIAGDIDYGVPIAQYRARRRSRDNPPDLLVAYAHDALRLAKPATAYRLVKGADPPAGGAGLEGWLPLEFLDIIYSRLRDIPTMIEEFKTKKT